jgi:integrase
MNVFSEFLITEKLGTYAPDKIYVSEISVGIIEKYIAWRRRVKKNTDATINHALTPILKGCKQATLDGYISQSLNNAIQGMRIISKKSLEDDDASNIRHLSRQEIDRLLNWYANDTEPRRKEYIEMFLFAMHTFAVHALNQGVTMTAVSQLLGHTSSKVTEKVYAHYVPATLSKELERIQLPALS